MKINFLLAVCSFILSLSCSDNPADNQSTVNASLQRMTDSLANYYKTQNHITQGGFFLKIITGTENYFVSSNIEPVPSVDYHYRIASVTKTFTAAAIMLLHQQGKLNIDDYITTNIPGTSIPYVPSDTNWNIPFKENITIKLLLQHRAGVFDLKNQPVPAYVSQPYAGQFYIEYIKNLPGNSQHTFTFDELAGVLAKNDLYNYTPNPNEYHYSNTGYSTLGKIIERVSGLSYSEFLRQNFFLPLNLNNTVSVYDGSQISIPLPKIDSYLYENGTMTVTVDDNMSANVAEGNLISTPEDVSRWIKLLLTGNAGVSMANVELMKQVIPTGPDGEAYGLGIAYIPGLGYGHNGAHLSYMDIAAYDPEKDIAMLVGSNFMYVADLAAQIRSMEALVKSGLTVVE